MVSDDYLTYLALATLLGHTYLLAFLDCGMLLNIYGTY